MTPKYERMWSGPVIAGGLRAAWATAALLVMMVAGCSTLGPPPMEPLTEQTLAAAHARWETHGADSYRLRVQVRAPRVDPAMYDLVVEGGKPVRIERNGEVVRPEDTAEEDFSIAGLFALLQQDLRWNAVEPIGDTPPIDLRARFEPETGRLVRYRRTVGTGKRRVLFIEVLAYEPLETPRSAAST